jgi:hypothetical protein
LEASLGQIVHRILTITKNGWGVAQGIGPEFEPQYPHPKERKKKTAGCFVRRPHWFASHAPPPGSSFISALSPASRSGTAWCQSLTPVILAIWEAEIGRIEIDVL